MSIRNTRLAEDFRRVRELAAAHPQSLRIEATTGAPPSRYLLEIGCRTITGFAGETPLFGTTHRLQIDLDASYPMTKPRAQMMSPIFNPHVFPSGSVCVGEIAWNPGESLDLFVRRLRSILVWDPIVVNPNSPANREAILWYQAHKDQVPFDNPAFGGGAPQQPVAPAKPRISWG